MKNLVIFLMVCFMVSLASVASAATMTFGDSTIYWPGWASTDAAENTQDVVDEPDLIGGSAEVNTGGLLTSLIFNRTAGASDYWNMLSPGDLFIDLGANQNWDYVVDITEWNEADKDNWDVPAGDYELHSIDLSLSSATGYVLSGADGIYCRKIRLPVLQPPYVKAFTALYIEHGGV